MRTILSAALLLQLIANSAQAQNFTSAPVGGDTLCATLPSTVGGAVAGGIASCTLPAGQIGKLVAANFNVTTDQPISIVLRNASLARYRITEISVNNCAPSMTTAQGGVYTAISKGGTAIVAAGQAYTSATTTSKIVPLTLATTDVQTASGGLATLYLSLTTVQGAAATCDVIVKGEAL